MSQLSLVCVCICSWHAQQQQTAKQPVRRSHQILLLMQMGVDRIFLDAASETAESVWCALGFSAIHPRDYKVLARQYCLVLNSDRYVAARCLKHIPHQATLLEQVKCTKYKQLQRCLQCPTWCCNNSILAPHNYTSLNISVLCHTAQQ